MTVTCRTCGLRFESGDYPELECDACKLGQADDGVSATDGMLAALEHADQEIKRMCDGPAFIGPTYYGPISPAMHDWLFGGNASKPRGSTCDHCGRVERFNVLCAECEQLACNVCGRVECCCGPDDERELDIAVLHLCDDSNCEWCAVHEARLLGIVRGED